jgi:hypothetical protein
MTHKERILRHLKDYGSITALECFKEYGTLRLSHYIWLLKREKYNITDEIIKGKNRYDEPTHYKRYYLNLNQES